MSFEIHVVSPGPALLRSSLLRSSAKRSSCLANGVFVAVFNGVLLAAFVSRRSQGRCGSVDGQSLRGSIVLEEDQVINETTEEEQRRVPRGSAESHGSPKTPRKQRRLRKKTHIPKRDVVGPLAQFHGLAFQQVQELDASCHGLLRLSCLLSWTRTSLHTWNKGRAVTERSDEETNERIVSTLGPPYVFRKYTRVHYLSLSMGSDRTIKTNE